ncbi:hypothetical protein KC367_g1387 [Hortaea werneckii]|nr:hypothetical protein KC367_g1387 [Hortaea werneckii]
MVKNLSMLALIIAHLVYQATSSNFECPAVNNLVVQDDYGVQYVVSCGTDADPGAYSSSGASNNWNECFQACSTHSIDANGAGGPCNGFTYAGTLNGKGGGTCYFKSGNMRFVGSGSGLISVATPERCPGCNIAGYANGTSPRSSSVAGVQTVSVTYTTIQTRTETATRYSTNTITTTGTVTTTAVSSYYTTAITAAVSTSRETLTTTTVQNTTQPASTVTSVSTYSTTTVVTYTSVVPASTQTLVLKHNSPPSRTCQAAAYDIVTQICTQYEDLSGDAIYSPNTQFATLVQRVNADDGNADDGNADDGAFGAESISEPDPTSVSSDKSPSESTQSSQLSSEQSFTPTIASSIAALETSSVPAESNASAFVQSSQMSSDSTLMQVTSGEQTHFELCPDRDNIRLFYELWRGIGLRNQQLEHF